MNTLRNVVTWIVYSSKDTSKLSRTLKWGVSALVIYFGWQGVDQAVIEPLLVESSDQIVTIVASSGKIVAEIAQVVTQIGAVWFGILKIYNTVFQENK